MELVIKNIAKIKNATIDIDGITVIAGENNTGKSTVGKVLFSLFYNMHDINKKITEEKRQAIDNEIFLYQPLLYMYDKSLENRKNRKYGKIYMDPDEMTDQILKLQNMEISYKEKKEEIKDILFKGIDGKNPKLKETKDMEKHASAIARILDISQEQFIETILEKSFDKEFNGQIKNIFSDEDGYIKLKVKDRFLELKVNENTIKYIDGFDISKEVIYIDNPFVIDEISGENKYSDVMHKNHLLSQLKHSGKNNTIEEIIQKGKIEKIIKNINKISQGELVQDGENAVYQLKGTKKSLDIKNISAGLKTFVILKQLILNGSISENSTIILDEPEIHLHPQWQLTLAELIVLMQKEFDLNILLTTHSPYFLNAIEVFSAKYDIKEKCNYYLSSKIDNQAELKNVNGDTKQIYSQLARPLQILENERYSDEIE